MKNNEKYVNEFCGEIISLAKSLKENICDSDSIVEKWNAVDKFMIDIERLQDSQKMTSRKSFTGLDNGKDVDGNTRYIRNLASMPIMVNSIANEDGSLAPTEVSEMHIGEYDGKKVLFITPLLISLD